MKELEKGRKHTDYVSSIGLEKFLETLMWQLGKEDIIDLVEAINSGEEVVENIKTGWKDRKSIIKFSVKSDGTEGYQWVPRLENKGIYVDDAIKELLLNQRFVPTTGVLTKVVVIKRDVPYRGEEALLKEVNRRDLTELGLEESLLIREKFSRSQLSLMDMHKIIIKSGRFGFRINTHGKPCIHVSDFEWDDYFGFAFGKKVKN